MMTVERGLGEMAHRTTPVRGHRTGEFDASWQPVKLTAGIAGVASAKPKKLCCKTCFGERCIGRCRF